MATVILTWRIKELMSARGIMSASELQRRLAAVGHTITPVHAMRLVATGARRLDLELLSALLTVLSCSPNDLLLPADQRPDSITATPWQHQDGALPPDPESLTPIDDPYADKRSLLGPRLRTFPKRLG